mmetsp:Transcript_2125/g.4941  ORF Transcript_2125/g.4941 Transcript_2125/m.4941 type:complete len:123 (+) Transcript_2125:125-493(+)|eukprot:CAMPEP_0178982170 /NCGR_PEP_ID=MMETSP0795-20121207/349_1 /TAXON_ID=88552 /ORGANISM="Amoebophrya sp., Strain Ameob2" /LENGTH=122 /DNA_ID=CAMNT_0020672789 /DNA_START=43 /DNA_END=411 /DNA_ORIENTATION=+
MSGKSQELINKLLQAEDEAEKIIKNARDSRSSKLKDVKAAAEEELAPFRMKEETKFMEDQRAMAMQTAQSAELEKATAAELASVKGQYEGNKKQAIKFILDKVLDIDLSVPENIKNALLMGA